MQPFCFGCHDIQFTQFLFRPSLCRSNMKSFYRAYPSRFMLVTAMNHLMHGQLCRSKVERVWSKYEKSGAVYNSVFILPQPLLCNGLVLREDVNAMRAPQPSVRKTGGRSGCATATADSRPLPGLRTLLSWGRGRSLPGGGRLSAIDRPKPCAAQNIVDFTCYCGRYKKTSTCKEIQ